MRSSRLETNDAQANAFYRDLCGFWWTHRRPPLLKEAAFLLGLKNDGNDMLIYFLCRNLYRRGLLVSPNLRHIPCTLKIEEWCSVEKWDSR
jgi:hypothetical protein